MKLPINFPDFQDIKDHLSFELQALEKTRFETEGSILRTLDDATIIFDFLVRLAEKIGHFTTQNPTLASMLEDEFVSQDFFWRKSHVVDLLFLSEYLFEEKKAFPLVGEGLAFKKEFLNDYDVFFTDWFQDKIQKHKDSEKLIREELKLDIEASDLPCRCMNCIAEYRTVIRELAFDSTAEIITKAKAQIQEQLLTPDEKTIWRCAEIFRLMKSNVESSIHKLRYKLKKSSIHKFEGQLRELIEEEFHYPSEVAKTYGALLGVFLKNSLKQNNIRSDLAGTEELERFYIQLGSGIWRGENFIEREFQKLIKSLLLLKRQDISSQILREYLGEFWLHTEARRLTRKIIYHAGPTNSGKTYQAIQSLAKSAKGCYLAPLRLLAAELYDTLNQMGVPTKLLTGEEVIEIPGAHHTSSTIEMAKITESFDCCVIDEIQMLNDPQRGWAWTRALINVVAKEVHICGDDSAMELVKTIVALTGDQLEVKYYERMTELVVEDQPIKMGDLDKGDALIVFSRKNALKYKRDLEQMSFKVSIVYGMLNPEVRREQARKFDKGETDVIVSTDAISMGMNLPIKRIVFSTLKKFFNSKEYQITPSEIKQISGRAGRFGRFPIGYVTCLTREEHGIESIQAAVHTILAQKKDAVVGPDLDIFRKVNIALKGNGLPILGLVEFLRLFNTMKFQRPFYCMDLKEMIEIAEMVEEADQKKTLTDSEIFGFACAPLNLGLLEHVQYFIWILNNYVTGKPVKNEFINASSDDIDYLETSIKCVELYQWLARHFENHNFSFVDTELNENKSQAVEKLNELLSQKTIKTCSSCGVKLDLEYKFNICDDCFRDKRFRQRPSAPRDYRPRPKGNTQSRTAKASHSHAHSNAKNNSSSRPQKSRNRRGPR